MCQKREFTIRSSSCEVMKKMAYFFTSQTILFPINFSVVETVVVCQKLIHVYAYVLVV